MLDAAYSIKDIEQHVWLQFGAVLYEICTGKLSKGWRQNMTSKEIAKIIAHVCFATWRNNAVIKGVMILSKA